MRGKLTVLHTQFSTYEVQKLQDQVKEIDESRVDGNFVGPDGEILRGSERVSHLVDVCLKWSEIVLERYVQPNQPISLPASY